MHPSLADRDLFVLHIEATDEAGHQGRSDVKVDALERWDTDVIGPVVDALDAAGEPYRILLMPDHATPVHTKTHSAEPVPYLLFDSARAGRGRALHRARDGRVRARSAARVDGSPRRGLTSARNASGIDRIGRVFDRGHALAAPWGIGCVRSLETSPRERFSAEGAGSPHVFFVLSTLGEIVQDLPRARQQAPLCPASALGNTDHRITLRPL